ncbi:unnamed protein product [Leuciscus chuanchicus]
MGSRIKESPGSTFEVYMEVVHSGTAGSGPEVRRSFPDTYADQETLQTIPKFCFPFNMDSMSVGHVGQNFTFVLTDIESKQRFGFCRLSSGAHSCHCILSYLPWFEVFYKLLNILADYSTKGQDSQWRELLESLHVLNIPDPGVPVHMSVHLFFTVPDPRELPSIPENRNLTEYFVAVDVNNMLHLYASMLYERRILISCSKLSTKVRGMALDDVVLLNVDTNTLETPFDDLQNLPNDVVSSLKNRLRKVSSTTGDGVARAFLKAQAALFGSYRNALHIEPFIDGRLELLNTGEGFSDQFEEEINIGEYAGSDKTYQWLFTVKKGSGAILNTVKTKANPAMKTVYKFAKDHAKMGIKEVKSRLKQKELAENGYSEEPGSTNLPSTHSKDSLTWDQRRPITVHFGQTDQARPPRPQRPPPPHPSKLQRSTQPARPPRPLVVKRPRSNIGVEGSPEHYVRPTRHYTVFLCEDSSGDELSQDDDSIAAFPEHFMLSAPFEWSLFKPQPYRSLKEAELVEEGEEVGERFQGNTAPSSPVLHKFSDLSLLQDAFRSQQGEPECTETTNTTKPSLSTHSTISSARSLEELRADPQHANFNYQRMDLSSGERTRTLPGLKTTNPYSKLWSQLEDPSTLLGRESLSWERPLSVPPLEPPEARPPSRDSSNPSGEKTEGACITIPRPQGRKTPEPGAVLAPAVTLLRGVKQVCEKEGGGSTGGQEFRQALNMSPHSQAQTQADLLKPNEEQGLDLLSLLDPLCGTMKNEAAPSLSKPPIPPRPNPPNLPAFPPPVSLNPFTQTSQYPPQRHYSPVAPGNPFTTAYMPSPGANYFPTSARPFSVYGQASAVVVTPTGGAWSTGRVPPSSSSSGSLSSLLDSPAPAILAQPAQVSTDAPHDPFSELLTMATTPTVMATPPPKKVEDLRRRWETFD